MANKTTPARAACRFKPSESIEIWELISGEFSAVIKKLPSEGGSHYAEEVLTISHATQLEVIAHCLSCVPEEACGLLIGDYASEVVDHVVPTENVAHSAMVYTVDPGAFLAADRAAAKQGFDVIGVYHSHTHTEAYPSPTDVSQAPDPGWHYVLVSLRDIVPVFRSYSIVEGTVTEELVVTQ